MIIANQKALAAVTRFRQMTASTVSAINKKMDRVAFVRRNKKLLATASVIWCLSMIGGNLLLEHKAKLDFDSVCRKISKEIDALAEESGAILLEDKVLDMARKVSEFKFKEAVLFTAILNDEKRIKAHSNPERINRVYQPPEKESRTDRYGKVIVSQGRLPQGGDRVLTFERPIAFSGIEIGKVVVVAWMSQLKESLLDHSKYKLLLFVLVTLLVGGGALAYHKHGRGGRPESDHGSHPMETGSPYRLLEKIGRGGMAELYKADYRRQDGFRRFMAVKRVLPHLAENEDFVRLFVQEARLAALLQHPNIVQIFDFGKMHNADYIAMEYIDGLNLGQIMNRIKSSLPVNMAVFIGIKICLGLDYSHNRKDDQSRKPLGIVHRDISPQNILVSYQGEVKISDFGISKVNTDRSLTIAGVVKGKLDYLSPEQALGQTVDRQCDIYALGIVLYEILSATRVYQFKSDIDAIRSIPDMRIEPLSTLRPDIPDRLNSIVMKCLEKDKSLRYTGARQLHDDLVQLKTRLLMAYDETDLANFMQTSFG